MNKERVFMAFSVSAICWLTRFAFAWLDGALAPVWWSAQWMDTVFVFLIGVSELVGLVAALIGVLSWIKLKIKDKEEAKETVPQ